MRMELSFLQRGILYFVKYGERLMVSGFSLYSQMCIYGEEQKSLLLMQVLIVAK